MAAATSCHDGSFGPWAGPACRGGFDFTLYFEEAILSIPLDAIFLVAAAWTAQRHFQYDIKTRHNNLNELRTISKLTTATGLVALRLALLIQWADPEPEVASSRTRATVPAAALSFAAAIAYLLLSRQEHNRTVRPSFEIEMYLFFATLLNLARARTLWMEPRLRSTAIPAVFTACLAVQAACILFESWEKRRLLQEPFCRWAGESLAGTFNRSLFCWLCPLLLTGSRTLLTLSDLPPLDPKLEAGNLEIPFNEAWENVLDKSKSGALMGTWLSAHAKWVLAGAVPRLFQIAFTFSQPWLVETAIAFAATPDETKYNNIGYGLVGAYVLVYTGIAISTGQHQWRMVRTATYMRGALVPVITRKTLRIDLAQAASASALTLITTDIETIDAGIKSMHELWAAPLELGLGAYLLYRQIGQAMGIPVGVVFAGLFIALFMAVPIGLKLAEWIKASEVRVAATSHTLGNVKSYRMAGLNSVAFAAIEKLRAYELQVSRTFRLWFGAATMLPLCMASLNPVLSFAGFIGLSSGGGGLTISQALTSLSILALLNRPLSSLSVSLTSLFGAVASFGRVQEYLNIAERQDRRIWSRPSTAQPVESERASSAGREPPVPTLAVPPSLCRFDEKSSSENTYADESILPHDTLVAVHGTLTWPGSDEPVLDIRELRIPSGVVTLLQGPTGCGKSTLLHVILGELALSEGCVRIVSPDASYCAQNPWLPNGTIRDAVVGKMGFDGGWYSRTVAACALLPDLAALPDGDQSLLGNKATSLSGGQKQRIAIARAVYARRRLCIFDDAFKGLDNSTLDTVLESLFGRHGLLRNNGVTSIVSSSDSRFVHYANQVVNMDAYGRIASREGPKEHGLFAASGASSETQRDGEATSSEKGTSPLIGGAWSEGTGDHELRPAATVQEVDLTRQEGDATVHAFYARAAGWRSVVFFLSALVVSGFTDAFSQIWVVWWTEAIEKDPDASHGKWLGVFSALGVIGIVASLLACWEIFITVITKTGLYFHSLLVQTVSRAPMSFFHTVDQGVTVNRFSQDMQLIDMELPGSALGVAMAFSSVVAQAVLMGVTGRYIAVAFPFLVLVFYLIQKFYLRTSRQMRFLDIEHTAPLYSHTMEILDGLASIRAFGFEGGYVETVCRSLDESQRPAYLLGCLQQWLLFASDMTVAVLAVILITITTTLRQEIGVGFMGLALSNIVAFGSTVQMLLVTWVQLEISIGAIARVKKFSTSVEPERASEPSTSPPADWPSRGQLSFRNVSASYPGTGRVLHEVNLTLLPGTKVGVCGRTGSGKSSLALTLFKLIQLDQGTIYIDDLDIATVAPDTLRESIAGVPQDFLSLGGTLRRNVDPHGAKHDAEIIEILNKAQLWAVVEPRGGLDMVVSEDVLSFGELQLLAFARVMARRSTVLVLDEITSCMDDTTAAVVDKLIHTEFGDWTIISVAHKLESIRHFDKIVVLDAGRIVEYDSPNRLLAEPSSFFRKLYEGKIE